MSDASDPAAVPVEPPPVRAGAELVIPALAGAFTLYFIFTTMDLAWEARANGVVIGTALLVLIALQIVRATRRGLAEGRWFELTGRLMPPATRTRLAMIGVLVVWTASIDWLGTTLSLGLAMAAVMRLLGERRWQPLLITSAATALSVYFAFVVLLQVRLPAGVVERLLDPTFRPGG